MNDLYIAAFQSLEMWRKIADINIGKSGEDVCGSCRGHRYREKDALENLIR